MSALWILLAACLVPPAGTGDDVASDCATPSRLVATTTDFEVGALATLDLATLDLLDDRAPTSGDPTLAIDGCTVFQLNRGLGDSVRVYEPGQWSAPRTEFALPAANPHALALVGDEVWLTGFDTAELLHVGLDGEDLGGVDLSAWADGDGLPEADSLLHAGDELVVALQRLNRETWRSADGVLLWLDPTTGDVRREVPTGSNPRLYPRGDGFLLLTGHLTELDGEIATLGADQESPSPRWTEQDLGQIALDYSEQGERGLILAASPGDYGTTVHCVDWRADELVGQWSTAAWISGVVFDRPERAWLALRPSWGDTPGPSGLLPFDPIACEPLTEEPLATHLPPYDLAVY